MKIKKTHDYKSEQDLCTVFSEHAKALGWRVFPETSDHDLLLVATDKVKTINAKPGDQIGVQAKLHDNIEVLSQAMPLEWGETGPHFHAVLVPVAEAAFQRLAKRLRIEVFEGTRQKWSSTEGCWVRVRGVDSELRYLPTHLRHYYSKPDWHPEIELWTPPGVASPLRITPWKIKAIRLCLRAIERGFVTTADFRDIGIDMGRWTGSEWIVPTEEKVGRHKKYVLNPAARPPNIMYPEITAALKADIEAERDAQGLVSEP